MSFTEIFVIFIMVIILVMYVQNHYGEVEYVQSSVDKKQYLVRKLSDKQQAANYLANINIDLSALVKHMVAKYPSNEDAQQLYKNYNPDAVSEGSIESGYTSYSVNKGEKLILCIRQKDKSFVKKNVILYVAIHELAHIMTKEVGHTTMFWDNFKFLLQEAIDIGIYEKINFSAQPHEYCGIQITNSVI
jgi:hypothetical protein